MPDLSSTGLPAIPGLLDRGLLTGWHEVTTRLRPNRPVQIVPASDPAALLAEIALACQDWGGGSRPIVPLVDGVLPTEYVRQLEVSQIDVVRGPEVAESSLHPRVGLAAHCWTTPALLLAASEPMQRWQTVQVVELAEDDPWQGVYAAVLGTWPEVPDPRVIRQGLLREDLRFEEIVPVERVSVQGSLEDLMARTRDREHFSPRQVANIFLAHGLEPDTSFLGVDNGVLPTPYATRRAAGPNILVVVTPGSVEDLALLWTLRGAHGLNRALPIGIPNSHLDVKALRAIQMPGGVTPFGLGGGECHLISTSVSLDELESYASLTDGVVATAYEEVLTFGPAPGRVRSHVLSWLDGRTQVDPLTEADHKLLRVAGDHPNLVLDVEVRGHALPTDPTMRGTEFFGRFQGGEAQVNVSRIRSTHTVEVTWPSGWTCLAAVAQTRGLDVTPSPPGLAAATLIRTIGGVHELELLAHQPLIDLLYEMGERSGMSWWKKRWTSVHRAMLDAGADWDTLEQMALQLGRDDPAIAPPGEGRSVPFQIFVEALGGDRAARHWVSWAERRHLLVRGADVTCPGCGTESWLPLAALPPPIACPGCGRQIDHPYPARELRFTYRLGEPLRRVLETDSLGHLLVLRWATSLFGEGLVGAHPGVTFTDSGRDLGEADVVLLFADGTLVPIEVKRRGAGVDDRTLGLMDTLADALDATWDMLAVGQPARDVLGIARAERRRPARPRLLLTNDQMHERHIHWSLGSNPFEWKPRTAEQDNERENAFRVALAANDPDIAWDAVGDALLNPEFRARRTARANEGVTLSPED